MRNYAPAIRTVSPLQPSTGGFPEDRVSIRWKATRRGAEDQTVSADEFLRRFLIHVLPKGLVRIRHFGLFANRRRSNTLARCRAFRGVDDRANDTEITHLRCPVRTGPMLVIERMTSSQLHFRSGLILPDPRGAVLIPPEISMTQLAPIIVGRRRVQTRHALVCSTAVLPTIRTLLLQSETPRRLTRRDPRLSSFRFVSAKTIPNLHC